MLKIDWAADGCCFYHSYEHFKEKGLGFVVMDGEQLIAIASSYNTYNNIIGVTIGTLDEYRRQGVATACAASLILECLNRGIYPDWSAANLSSVGLAQKLGYQMDGEMKF